MEKETNYPEIISVILKRHSCRSFHPDPIPEDVLEHLKKALQWAPSGGNRQPWHFYIVKNNDLKAKLMQAAYNQEFLKQAPLVFVICAIPERSGSRYGDRGRNLYVYQDTAAATENLLLTATALGYGSCWIGAFNEKAVSSALKLPEEYRPVTLVPIGKPAEEPEASTRLDEQKIFTLKE